MKRILYFDCFSGISGDMTLGALVDLGADPGILEKELAKLHVDGYHLHFERTQRAAISGTNADVHIHDHDHDHDHHDHDHDHEHDHHDHGHHHEHARNLSDITKIIQESTISENAKKLALDIFTEIAIAEAHVHGKSLAEVHFHEVGAVDSIVDIVGTAICLDLLKIDRIVCSPIQEGRGFVKCQHGLLPVPVPAVSQMLAGSKLSLIQGDTAGELVTPTGFGILKAAAESCGPMPDMTVEKVGYGFGKRDTGRLNALRLFLGVSNHAPDTVTVIEATLDDERGEILGYTMERLFEAGALDVYYTPVFMKKNRPAVQMTILCQNDDLEKMTDIVFTETSTIGLRHRTTERMVLPRREASASAWGCDVQIKISGEGKQQKIKAEYDDCARIAKERGIPLRKVYEAIDLK